MFFYGMLSVLDTDKRNFVESLFEKYHKHIYEIAYRILHNHHDAEDTLNEVMISILKNIDKFFGAPGNEIEAQIVIYSRNAAINLYNKNKRRAKSERHYTHVNDDGEFEEIVLENMGEDLDEIIINAETTEIVRRHIKLLPIEQRDVIKLVYYLGYTNVEAAKILHITPNAVGLRLYKAKKKLLDLAGGELDERIGSDN